MNFDFFNKLLNKDRENNKVKDDKEITDFMNEVSNKIENENNNIENINMVQDVKTNSLKEEDCLYQVVEMTTDGAYLENKNDHKIYKEIDISKDVWLKIGNDYILRYKDGAYYIEDELTEEFFNSLED